LQWLRTFVILANLLNGDSVTATALTSFFSCCYWAM